MSSSEKTHKVQNWGEYNDALVDRGRLTVWISGNAAEDWKSDRPPQQGAQWTFSDQAIKTCLQIKVVYGLTLRETEGFVESLFELMELEDLPVPDYPVPDYTTLSKRQGDLEVEIQAPEGTKGSSEEGSSEEGSSEEGRSEEGRSEEDGGMHLVIDSTGLKVHGEGEWKQRTHGKQKRRTWRKLHLGVATLVW